VSVERGVKASVSKAAGVPLLILEGTGNLSVLRVKLSVLRFVVCVDL
jgi:hypothetical protein